MKTSVHLLSVLCLLSGAALTGSLGFVYLLDPETISKAAQIEPQSAAGLSEIRSTYGGLHIGIAAFLVACSLSQRLRRAGLLFCFLAFAGAGLGRAGGILEFRPAGTGQVVTALLEMAFSGISFFLWYAWPAAQRDAAANEPQRTPNVP
jgi:hypothetical protein